MQKPLCQRAKAGPIGWSRRWKPRSACLPEVIRCHSLSIVKRIEIRGVQVHQASNPFRVSGGNGAQFFPAKGVPNQDGLAELQRIEYGQHIITKTVSRVIRAGIDGCAESTPGNSVHM